MVTPFHPLKPREPGSIKDSVGRAYRQAGGVPRAMTTLQIGQSQAYAYADPDSPQQMTLLQAAALTTPGVSAIAEHFAALAGGAFLPLVVAGGGSEIHALTAASAREFGEAVGEIVSSLADGRLDAREKARCIGEIDDALRSLASLRAAVTSHLSEPGEHDGQPALRAAALR